MKFCENIVSSWCNREEIPHWVKFFDGKLPNEAHVGGRENGEPIYIGRAKHEGSLTPGKYYCLKS